MRPIPWQVDDQEIGRTLSLGNTQVYLGGRGLEVPVFSKALKDISPVFLKQVHGSVVHEVTSPTGYSWTDKSPEGDGMVTNLKNVALTIVTADCLPILISQPQRSMIAACHAGWRGLVSGVVAQTLEKMKLSRLERADLRVVIGPHIQPESFEVGLDVAEQIIQATPLREKVLLEHENREKKYVDLTLVAITQLQSLGLQRENIWFDDRNTFADKDLSSYRRDGPGAGRNLSSIVIKS